MRCILDNFVPSRVPLRLVLIGGGAVSEMGHLPALREARCFDIVALVDKNEARAAKLAAMFKVPHSYNDYRAVIEKVDAAIVALPHILHGPVGRALLEAGKHVLVEKPMAVSVAECDGMNEAAARTGACLAVGNMRRFFPSILLGKELLDRRLIGRVRHFDFRDGYTYSWPVASDFFFRKETAGGGVLLDTGAHTLDTLLWLLDDVAEFIYRDDDRGGIEADCVISLSLKSGVTGVVELSRTRILRNSAIIEGDDGALEIFFHQPKVTFRPRSGQAFDFEVRSEGSAIREAVLVQMLCDQLLDWHEAIVNRRAPRVSGKDGRRVVALLEQMYQHRKPLILPWEATNSDN